MQNRETLTNSIYVPAKADRNEAPKAAASPRDDTKSKVIKGSFEGIRRPLSISLLPLSELEKSSLISNKRITFHTNNLQTFSALAFRHLNEDDPLDINISF